MQVGFSHSISGDPGAALPALLAEVMGAGLQRLDAHNATLNSCLQNRLNCPFPAPTPVLIDSGFKFALVPTKRNLTRPVSKVNLC